MARAMATRVVEGVRVEIDLEESPLAWLMRRDMISRRQFDAGEQLRRDFEMASLGPRVTMSWSGAPSARRGAGPAEPLDATTAQIEAKLRFEAATAAAGPGLCDILWRVVCAGEGLGVAERGLGWPTRSAKLVLGLALDRLAGFYGMR